ncbi:MAG: PilZ domain-containing protein [Planctomycetes bacterium]|nr:PilZ domain-containing protein [Planctomycetota bacterium]
MFFKRKRNRPTKNRRNKERQATPELTDLIIEICLPSGDTIPGHLQDLTIEGSGVLIPRVLIPDLKVRDRVLLSMAHPHEEWQVQTPATVRTFVPQDPHEILLGLQFENFGNLYAQLDDSMGLYFNRRSEGRTKPSEQHPIEVQISNGATKSLGKIHDLSAEGMCIALPHVQAFQVKPGTQLKIAFQLPSTRKVLRGCVQVQQLSLRGGFAYLGATLGREFDVNQAEIAAYLVQRHIEDSSFLEDLEDSDAPTPNDDQEAA